MLTRLFTLETTSPLLPFSNCDTGFGAAPVEIGVGCFSLLMKLAKFQDCGLDVSTVATGSSGLWTADGPE